MKNSKTALNRSLGILCTLLSVMYSSMFCSLSDAVKKTQTDRNISRIVPGVPEETKAARIYEDGRMEVLKINPDSSWTHSGKSKNAVSPDGRYIAYSKDNNSFWLFDADSGEDIPIHPKLNDYGYFTSEGWSVNNDKLMYKLEKNSKISYFIYSLKDRTKTQIDLPGKFVSWTADDEMVISSEEGLFVKGKETRKLPVSNQNFDFYQIVRSPDGKKLYGRYNQGIASIDLSSGSISSITPEGGYTEYQWPFPSPSGKRVAYEHQTGSDAGIPTGTVDADGIPVIQYRGGSDFHWIGNKTIVIKDECSLRTADIETKKIKILKLDPKGRYIYQCNGNGQLPADEEITERETLRITSESGLFLREEPSEKSAQILLVPFAHTVFMNRRKKTDITVQGKTGRWTLVSYYSAGKEYEGWMFGGYLGPVRQDITAENIKGFKSGCFGSSCNGCGSYDFSPDGKFRHSLSCHGGEITGKWALVGKEIRVCTKPKCSPKTDKELVFRASRDGQIIYENLGTAETVFNADQIYHWEPPH